MGAESIVPVPAGDGRVFLKHRQDVTTMLRLLPEGDAAPGRNAVDGTGAARDLRDSRLPRRLSLRHERPHHAHLRRRRDRRPALALARAGRRLPAAGGRRPRRAHQGADAARGQGEPRRLDGARPARAVQGRRVVAPGLRGRRRLRAQPGRARACRVARPGRARAPRRLRRRLAPPRSASRASSTSFPPRRTSPLPWTASWPRFPRARSSSGRTGSSSCIAERRPTRASSAT